MFPKQGENSKRKILIVQEYIAVPRSFAADVEGGNCSFLINCKMRTTTKRVHIFLDFNNIDE